MVHYCHMSLCSWYKAPLGYIWHLSCSAKYHSIKVIQLSNTPEGSDTRRQASVEPKPSKAVRSREGTTPLRSLPWTPHNHNPPTSGLLEASFVHIEQRLRGDQTLISREPRRKAQDPLVANKNNKSKVSLNSKKKKLEEEHALPNPRESLSATNEKKLVKPFHREKTAVDAKNRIGRDTDRQTFLVRITTFGSVSSYA